jgi:hypothetical protein
VFTGLAATSGDGPLGCASASGERAARPATAAVAGRSSDARAGALLPAFADTAAATRGAASVAIGCAAESGGGVTAAVAAACMAVWAAAAPVATAASGV